MAIGGVLSLRRLHDLLFLYANGRLTDPGATETATVRIQGKNRLGCVRPRNGRPGAPRGAANGFPDRSDPMTKQRRRRNRLDAFSFRPRRPSAAFLGPLRGIPIEVDARATPCRRPCSIRTRNGRPRASSSVLGMGFRPGARVDHPAASKGLGDRGEPVQGGSPFQPQRPRGPSAAFLELPGPHQP